MSDNHNDLIRNEPSAPIQIVPSERYDLYPPSGNFGFQLSQRKHITEYVRLVMKRKWIVLTCVAMALLAATMYTKRQTPIYQAGTNIEIDLEESNVLPYQGFNNNQVASYDYAEYLETQIKHITSRTLARRVVLTAGLDKEAPPPPRPDLVKDGLASLRAWLNGAKPATLPQLTGTQEDKIEQAIGMVQGGLAVTPVRNSQVVEISYRSPDPKLAARIANVVAAEYIEYNFQAKYDATTRATVFLQKQLLDLKAKVEDSETALLEYAREHNMMNIGEKQDVVMQALADINSKLTEARMARMDKESVYRTLAMATPENFPQALRTPMIERLEEKLQADEQELAKVSAQLGPAMPQVKQLESQVRRAREQLLGEKKLAIEHAGTDYDTAMAHEKLLTDAFNQQKTLANQLNESNIHYNILKREVETSKQLYDGLLQRMKEAGVAAGLKSSNIRVVDQAEVPGSPISPNLNMNLSMALMVGLALGLGLAFFLNYLDVNVKTPEDVEQMTDLPALGLIPSLQSTSGRYGYLTSPRKRRNRSMALVKQGGVELASLMAGSSMIAEAYRGVRTALLLSTPGNPPKVIMVTSSRAQEGKTTTVCNTALSLAQTGKKVLILDCDLRRPKIARIFKANSSGLSEYLTGQIDFSSIVQESAIPNLFLVHAGSLPPNPSELLGSVRLRDALTAAAGMFDFILIDTPPLMSVTDPLVVAPMADGVILVTKGAKNSPETLMRAKKSLDMVHAHILGVVCTNVNLRHSDYHYYYHMYAEYTSYVSDGAKKPPKPGLHLS